MHKRLNLKRWYVYIYLDTFETNHKHSSTGIESKIQQQLSNVIFICPGN